MFSFFSKKKNPVPAVWSVDMHSHLLPGIDDGVKTPEEALTVLKTMRDNGFRKWWITPHIYADYYPNTPETIRASAEILNQHIRASGEEFDISIAAEYFIDDSLVQKVVKNEELLLLAGKYLLVETNMLSEPLVLENLIFETCCRKMEPVLAHPERYTYLQGNFYRLIQLRHRGALFQVNALSFIGFYGPAARRMAREMTDRNLIDFIGSDFHNPAHAALLPQLLKDKYFQRAIKNNSVLS